MGTKPARLIFRGPDYYFGPETPPSETGNRPVAAYARQEVVSGVKTGLKPEGAFRELADTLLQEQYGGEGASWRDWNAKFAGGIRVEGNKEATDIEKVVALQKILFTELGLVGDPSADVDGRLGPYTLAALAYKSGATRPPSASVLAANPRLRAKYEARGASAPATAAPSVASTSPASRSASASAPEGPVLDENGNPMDEIVWVPEGTPPGPIPEGWTTADYVEYRAAQQNLDPSVLAFRNASNESAPASQPASVPVPPLAPVEDLEAAQKQYDDLVARFAKRNQETNYNIPTAERDALRARIAEAYAQVSRMKGEETAPAVEPAPQPSNRDKVAAMVGGDPATVDGIMYYLGPNTDVTKANVKAAANNALLGMRIDHTQYAVATRNLNA